MTPSYGNWQKYNSRSRIQHALIDRFLRRLVSLQAPLGIDTALDVGCAEGFVLDAVLAARPGLRVTGVDIDFEALRRGQSLHPHIPVGRADILHLPYASDSFDLVLCTEVLEHLPDPDAAVAEIRRVARRYCLFSVPHEPFFRLSNLLRGKNVSRLGNDIEHLHSWGLPGFVHLLEKQLNVVAVHRSFPWLLALGEPFPSS